MKRLGILCVILISFLAACGPKDLSVTDAWARTGFTGSNSAIYMTIDNPTMQDETLLSADCDAASSVELHMSMMDANGMMMMQAQENIPVAAGTKVELKPGGLHVMLIDLNRDLVVGESLTVTLHFQNAGDLILDVPIQEP